MSTKMSDARHPGGRPALLQAAELFALVALTRQMPQASMDELTGAFVTQTGIQVCAATIRKAFKRAGLQRVRPVRRAGVRAQAQRYGHADAHRRQDGARGMNSGLTDARVGARA